MADFYISNYIINMPEISHTLTATVGDLVQFFSGPGTDFLDNPDHNQAAYVESFF